ncbi:uncharacterized protein DSM5745_06150 [Aspergillus mulundensis]|uniref:Major facilitator superfamily (MFS) profile domain-containing protein n=1 Tax=Aspergillus mulundensis TaxID=1810919 RepID=A0A3D8RZ64_9EURO|nr:hypothetical protein DSM5745_06150 [Aspergillus mulundensis]RDW79298.1 hypothetical protein DSM5745_06150 [Aspergillus mulundensis]
MSPVQVVNLIYLAQLSSVTATGFMAQSMAQAVGGTDKTVWYSSCITIMTVALNPPISQAADYWGRKPVLVAFALAGVVGSLIVSRAQSSGVIIAGFAIVGLGFACQSVALAVLSEVLPRIHRPVAQASAGVASSLGGVMGLLLGGGLLRDGNLSRYRVFWYIEAGMYALAAVGCVVGYSPSPREVQVSLSTTEKLRRLDWVGYVLFPPALALFSMTLAWSDNPYSWSSANILGPFIIGVVAMVLFIIYECRFTKDGMLHHGLWRNRNFPVSLVVILVEGLSFFAANSYFSYEITVVYDEDILSAATNFAIMFFTGLVGSPVFGFWSSKRKSLRPPLVLGGIFLLLFFILLATVKIDTPRYVFWILPILPGIALASIVPLTMVSAQFAVSPELVTLASALMTTVRSLGGAIGLAINNAVINSSLNDELQRKVSAAVLPLGLPSSSLPALLDAVSSQRKDAAAEVPGGTPEIAQAAVAAMKRAYLSAFRNAWIVSAAFCGLMVICGFLIAISRACQNSCLPRTACYFIVEQRAQFDTRIDAPVTAASVESQTLGSMSPAIESSFRERVDKGTAEHHEGGV